MDSEIQQLAGDILNHPKFQQLRGFQHHGADNSVYDHSVAVAGAAYAIARWMRLSGDETASVLAPHCCTISSATIGMTNASAATCAGIPASSV